MKNVIKDIKNRKDLNKNLLLFADYLSSLHYRFSNICLSMNYYTFHQVLCDGIDNQELLKLTHDVNRVIADGILSDNISDDMVGLIEEVRAKIISTMKVLTSYADIFSIYEYVINRVEYRFSEEDFPKQYTDENFTRKLMNYIVADEDSVVINSRISEVIAQLPMRMTKSKFFERLNEGIDVYKDTDKKSLDDFLYMVRSGAMLELPNEKDDFFDDLKSIHNTLMHTDYENITSDEYRSLNDKINYAAVFIEDMVNLYMMLQQIVNNVYAILITKSYVKDFGEEDAVCKSIILSINKGFEDKTTPDEELFIGLEGKQEKIYEEYISYEYVLDDIKARLSDSMDNDDLKKQYDTLYKSAILLSESLFVEFNGNTIDDSEMSNEYFEQKKREFIEEVEEFFKCHGRVVNRAVMSAIISSLPVFFNNLEELQDYVFNSLDSCRQKAEKMACIEILNSVIEEITDYRKED